MEYIKYCFNGQNVSIFDINDKIDWVGMWPCEKNESKCLSILCLKGIAFAHTCNYKEFKCNNSQCKHINSGEVPLMTIESRVSFRKLPLVLLNEQFVATKDFDSLKNKSLFKCLFVPIGKLWIKHWLSCLILHCEVCDVRITVENEVDYPFVNFEKYI